MLHTVRVWRPDDVGCQLTTAAPPGWSAATQLRAEPSWPWAKRTTSGEPFAVGAAHGSRRVFGVLPDTPKTVKLTLLQR